MDNLKDYNLEIVEDEQPETVAFDDGVEQESEVEECPVLFQDELEWLFYIMPDKWLKKLIDRVEYGADNMEYYYDKKCLSCGCMRHIVMMMEKALVWRQNNGVKIEW